MLKRIRAGLLVSSLVAVAVVVPAATANASGSCGIGSVIETYRTTEGVPICVTRAMGSLEQAVDIYGAGTYVVATHHVVGYVDTYEFLLPTGGAIVLPCVVLTVEDRIGENPCARANGKRVNRVATLVDQSVDQPGAALDLLIASANFCHARYTVTVSGMGVKDFPAYALC